MLDRNVHDTLAGAYRAGLVDLLRHGNHVDSVTDPTSIASGFGTSDRPAIELLGYSFQVQDATSCLFSCRTRPIRLSYALGLLVWTLAGSDSVEWLSYYHEAAPRLSDDSVHLSGAFGKRLFAYRDSLNQVDTVIRRLRTDPNTRRAYCAVSTPEDNFSKSREYPCCAGIQYFVRDGALHAVTFMRAQSGMVVLPYDAFLFMALQTIVASVLGLRVGTYRHMAGTFHIYEAEIAQAEAIVASDISPVTLGGIESSDTFSSRAVELERSIRHHALIHDLTFLREMLEIPGSGDLLGDQLRFVFLAHAFSVANATDTLVGTAIERLASPMKELAQEWASRER